jgi:hypothetical protein
MTSAEFGLDLGYTKVFVYLQDKLNNVTKHIPQIFTRENGIIFEHCQC